MILNAYYFRHHMYTLVPRHVRDDMAWMRDVGTDVVSLAILEQDLYAARQNVDIICGEAERAGMKVYAVPSRWGGLVAGAPKVPSFFAATHPETWILNQDGSPAFSQVGGPLCSVHHAATMEFFRERLRVLLQQWPIDGVVWDEPKTLGTRDFSPPALQQLGPGAPPEAHTEAVARFFDDAGLYAHEVSPGVRLGMFLQCNAPASILERCARIENLDDFGCDGRPWRLEDGGVAEARNKMLLGAGERFLEAARHNAKSGLWLIENHSMSLEDTALMDKRLPQVLEAAADHLIYYYFPRSLPDPERQMGILAAHLKARLGRGQNSI